LFVGCLQTYQPWDLRRLFEDLLGAKVLLLLDMNCTMVQAKPVLVVVGMYANNHLKTETATG
jgi:hypothetical protein